MTFSIESECESALAEARGVKTTQQPSEEQFRDAGGRVALPGGQKTSSHRRRRLDSEPSDIPDVPGFKQPESQRAAIQHIKGQRGSLGSPL